jgi:hypothetical protein
MNGRHHKWCADCLDERMYHFATIWLLDLTDLGLRLSDCDWVHVLVWVVSGNLKNDDVGYS